jgi:hypothetical protein
MQNLMTTLRHEKARLEEMLQSGRKMADTERLDRESQLKTVLSDIDRLEMYIDRSTMQTFSELLFVDDIRGRVKAIQNRETLTGDQ